MAIVELNHQAVSDLLRAQGDFGGVMDDMVERGDRIATDAGDGIDVESFVGAHRARVSVSTATPEAMIAEASDGALSAALDAGRG